MIFSLIFKTYSETNVEQQKFSDDLLLGFYNSFKNQYITFYNLQSDFFLTYSKINSEQQKF